jgi:hypothetical protein
MLYYNVVKKIPQPSVPETTSVRKGFLSYIRKLLILRLVDIHYIAGVKTPLIL